MMLGSRLAVTSRRDFMATVDMNDWWLLYSTEKVVPLHELFKTWHAIQL